MTVVFVKNDGCL